MRVTIQTIKIIVLSMSASLFLSGCAATQLMLKKSHLDVQTKASQTVFLDPVPDAQKTIYVQIKNTSDKPQFKVHNQVVHLLQDKGYRVVTHLDQAHYLLQANILQVGKTSQSAAETMLAGGFGSSLSGAVVGLATAGALATHSTRGFIAGGLGGGLISTLSDNLVHDNIYSVITDVSISERVKNTIHQKRRANLKQGLNAGVVQTSDSQSHWSRSRTRILSSAERVNLKFATALPKLEAGLAHAMSGYF